jgi:hypothetical protein
MSTMVWGWIAVWMIVRLWLEWRVDRSWLPGTAEVQQDHTNWAVPPPNALTPDGERLWRVLYRVTLWGFVIWLLLVAIWFLS